MTNSILGTQKSRQVKMHNRVETKAILSPAPT